MRSEVYKDETSKLTTTKKSPKEQSKSEGKTPMESSIPKGRRCFECQGFWHIQSECPNWNIVTLIEKEIEDEEEANDEDQNNEEDVELVQPYQGLSIVVRKALKSSCEMEENWERTNVFHTNCTSKGRFYMVIIDSF